MRIQDIKVGESYRLSGTSCSWGEYYGWVKVLEVYRVGDYRSPDKTKSWVKCLHTVDKDSEVGFIRYFRPMRLVNTKVNR